MLFCFKGIGTWVDASINISNKVQLVACLVDHKLIKKVKAGASSFTMNEELAPCAFDSSSSVKRST